MQKWLNNFFTTVGIVFIVLAGLLFIDSLNLIPSPWGQHLGLTFFFLIILIFLLRWKFTFLSTIFISFIVMLHKAGLGLNNVSNWTILGIAILLGIGISLIYHPHINYLKKLINGDEPTPFATIEDRSEDEESINIYSRFSNTTKNVNEPFSKLKINAKVSDLTVNLNKSNLQAPTATIDINALSSTLTLAIPLEWNIDDTLSKLSSTISFQGPKNGIGSATIYLTGNLTKSKLNIIRV